MKSLILGAFILCMFFAVAQSVRIGQQNMQFNLKQSSTTAADTLGHVEYAQRVDQDKLTLPKTANGQTALALRK